MGMDKAFLPFRGGTLLERTLHVLHEVCASVSLVGDPTKFSSYGVAIPDIFPGCGPLAGIHAGLQQSSAELNLFLALDMPLIAPELLAFLLTKAEQTEAAAIVPRTARGLQPLCAVYRRSFAEIAEDSLRAGKYKIDAAFSGLAVYVIDEPELASHGFSERFFFNVNTPEDLQRAEDIMQLT